MTDSEQLTRRGFIERAVGVSAAGAAVVGLAGCGDAHRRVPDARPRRNISPNDKIAVGVIGVGGQGNWHLSEMLKQPDVVVKAVCDVWQERLDKAVARCEGSATGYRDYRDVLAREDIDAVLIASPPHWHALQGIHAVEAGKDLYIEKPMTINLGESTALLNAVRRHNAVTQVGTQIHATANYRRVVDVVRSGILGPINVARTSHVLNDGPDGIGYPENNEIPAGLDWEFWKGPGADRPYNYYLVKDSYTHGSFMYTGGWTPGMAPHVVDLPFWALELGYPTCASSSGGRFVVKDCGDAYDTHEVLWQFPGFTLTWMTSLVNSYGFDNQGRPGCVRRRVIYFHGVNGTLLADYGVLEVFPEGDRMSIDDVDEVPKVIPDSPGHHREWLDCIRTRQQPSCHVGYHHKIDVAINLAMLSLKLGRTVRFDPDTWQIVDDREASRLAVPEYRSPWRFPAEYLRA